MPHVPLQLITEQVKELIKSRDHDPRPYVRERAAGVLKVAGGMSRAEVARNGLLCERTADTVARWVIRYKQDGLAGLNIREGRGRKPGFFPHSRGSRASKLA